MCNYGNDRLSGLGSIKCPALEQTFLLSTQAPTSAHSKLGANLKKETKRLLLSLVEGDMWFLLRIY